MVNDKKFVDVLDRLGRIGTGRRLLGRLFLPLSHIQTIDVREIAPGLPYRTASSVSMVSIGILELTDPD